MTNAWLSDINNTIENVNEISSTSKNRVIDFTSVKSQYSTSSKEGKEVSYTSTPAQEKRELTSVEKQLLTNSVQNEEKQYSVLVAGLEQELLILLKNYSLENETMSLAESKIYDIANKYSFRVLGDIIQRLYVQYYNLPNVIAGICTSLERFDACEVMPWGQSMILGLINHKNELVKERVIGLIENWADVSLLPALKNIDISSEWMREYVDEVILFLEGIECTI
ncbi:hypothetical protein [Frisingicoccus sp.]|uniref:hypothetical protein n=1 Tax=Frisingicoccus sp. TaxID=1918627 RepID=UPI003AB1A92A